MLEIARSVGGSCARYASGGTLAAIRKPGDVAS